MGTLVHMLPSRVAEEASHATRSQRRPRDRQYEHIKDSYEDRGVSKGEAEERAARTVIKTRRTHSETKKK